MQQRLLYTVQNTQLLCSAYSPKCVHPGRRVRSHLAAEPGSHVCRRAERESAITTTSSINSVQQHAVASAGSVSPAWNQQDVIKATTTDGSDVYLEVISSSSSTQRMDQPQQHHQQLQVVHQGVVYSVEQTQKHLLLHAQGWQLQPDHPLVKALPGWPAVLQLQQSKQQLPQQPLQLQTAAVVSSAAQLQAAVQQNPGLWRDGTGPLDPPLNGLQYQTLAAGEIECLLNRTRGLVMLQLSVAWDAYSRQPVNNPLVLHNLQRALNDSGISIYMSPATGGVGLTAILCAKAEPWRSWAAHLVSFNAQAAVVAGSPYYKLLIGRMLGYKEDNIRFHIQATDGRLQPTPEVIAAVDKDMRKLSKKKAQLPWTADAGSARGGNRQQPRAVRKRQ